MKNIVLLFALFVAFGCGESSDDSLEDKQNIIILQNIPKGVCEAPEYKAALDAAGLNDYIVKETSDDVSCQTYGKSQEEGNCAIIPYYSTLKDTTNCVIGYTPKNEDLNKIPNGK